MATVASPTRRCGVRAACTLGTRAPGRSIQIGPFCGRASRPCEDGACCSCCARRASSGRGGSTMALDRASPATHRCLRGERLHALCGRWASGQAQPWRVGPALASSDARLSCSGKSCRCVRSVWLHDGCGVISAAEDGVALQACCVQASAGSCAFWFRGIGTECARDEAQR
eukprot:4062415-Prymnesium_polylepis.1